MSEISPGLGTENPTVPQPMLHEADVIAGEPDLQV